MRYNIHVIEYGINVQINKCYGLTSRQRGWQNLDSRAVLAPVMLNFSETILEMAILSEIVGLMNFKQARLLDKLQGNYSEQKI